MELLMQNLEDVIRISNPPLFEKLEPRLTEKRISRLLNKYKVAGDTLPIFSMYTWRDGVAVESRQMPEINSFEVYRRSFLPQNECTFLDLEHACIDFQALEEFAVSKPNLRPAVGNYFPMFSVGDGSWLATDLRIGHSNRIVLLDWDESLFEELYESFECFLLDVIRAQEGSQPLDKLPRTWKKVAETWYE